MSNAAFRYGRAREITIGAAPVLALRIGYTGELGWELHIPTEYAAHVYDVLREAGEPHSASSTSATGRSTGCGSRRATCTGRPTSRPTRRRWRPGSTGGSTGTRATSAAATRWSAQREAGVDTPALARSRSSRWRTRSAARRSSSTTRWSASPPPPTSATRVGKPIAYGYLPVEHCERTDFVIEVYGDPIPATRHDARPVRPQRIEPQSWVSDTGTRLTPWVWWMGSRGRLRGLPGCVTRRLRERLAGLTNVNYRVGEFVVRLPGAGTSEYIDRGDEAGRCPIGVGRRRQRRAAVLRCDRRPDGHPVRRRRDHDVGRTLRRRPRRRRPRRARPAPAAHHRRNRSPPTSGCSR